MNREEILNKSKQENRGRDIADLEASKASMRFGWLMAVCLLAVVSVVEALVWNRVDYGIFYAITAGCCAIFTSKYRRLRKRHELQISIIYGFAAAAFLIAWILQLVRS